MTWLTLIRQFLGASLPVGFFSWPRGRKGRKFGSVKLLAETIPFATPKFLYLHHSGTASMLFGIKGYLASHGEPLTETL